MKVKKKRDKGRRRTQEEVRDREENRKEEKDKEVKEKLEGGIKITIMRGHATELQKHKGKEENFNNSRAYHRLSEARV